MMTKIETVASTETRGEDVIRNKRNDCFPAV